MGEGGGDLCHWAAARATSGGATLFSNTQAGGKGGEQTSHAAILTPLANFQISIRGGGGLKSTLKGKKDKGVVFLGLTEQYCSLLWEMDHT